MPFNRNKLDKESPTSPSRIIRLRQRIVTLYAYVSHGVWQDTRIGWKVRIIKIINLSVRSFMSADLQSQACALTYRTLLAIVPALALLFAIGRGFGFQALLQEELYSYFPSQHKALEAALKFVDSYLNQASEGIFVGVGIVFLLWTLISLVSSVEDSFNSIWQVSHGRSLWRKITDYTAIFLILPVLMICAGGLSLMMSNALQSIFHLKFLRPAIDWMLDCGSYLFTWLFFAGAYMLIPNTKVKFVNALIAGIFVGSAFQVLQWLFVSGQMYVSKYNAIYGGFSFLPLLLIWLQLTWLITLIGSLLCYATQRVGQLNFSDMIKEISPDYFIEAAIVVIAVIAKRFSQGLAPLTSETLAQHYGIPMNLATEVVERLHESGLINYLEAAGEFSEHPLQPALRVDTLTVGDVVSRLQSTGKSGFIPGFSERYASVSALSDEIRKAVKEATGSVTLISLNISI